MARRSISFMESTPFYGFIGELNCITIKMYYGGTMKSTRKCKEYTGGAIEYFDFVDITKLSMVQLWGFVEELGFEETDSIRFWHKFGADLSKGRYLASDVDVPRIKDHIPSNYEVEIYIENDDGRSLNVNVEDEDGGGSADDDEEEQSSTTASVAPGQPSKRKKLPVRKPASQVGAHIEGSLNIISSINVNPVFVKGGMNFVIVSKLKASLGARRNHGHSVSIAGTPANATSVSEPNTAPMTWKEKLGTSASQASASRT